MKKVDGHVGIYRRTATLSGISTLYITYKDKGGKKIWKAIGLEPEYTPAIAKDIRDRCVAAACVQPYDNGKSKLTLDEAFSEFANAYVNMSLIKDVPALIRKYQKHIQPLWGTTDLSGITPVMINRQKAHWLKIIAPASVNQLISLLSRIYSATGPKHLGLHTVDNPVSMVKRLAVDNTRLRFLTKKEASKLMAMLKEIHTVTYRICSFALYAGLRKQEILSLRGANIDLENNILTIRTKDKKQGRMASLPIMPKLRAIIEGMFAEKYYKPNERLFTSRKFNYKMFGRAVDFCGLNDDIDWDDPDLQGSRFKVVLHTLRHSFASHLVADGIPLSTVQRLMRHSSIASTEIYSHVNDAQLKDAITKLENSWEGVDEN